jgi:hypothetical protein
MYTKNTWNAQKVEYLSKFEEKKFKISLDVFQGPE